MNTQYKQAIIKALAHAQLGEETRVAYWLSEASNHQPITQKDANRVYNSLVAATRLSVQTNKRKRLYRA